MHRVCIIGTGPTALYTLRDLLAAPKPLAITLYEKSGTAGTGMPYRADVNGPALLANIASVELPPVLEPLQRWLEGRSETGLDGLDVELEKIDERTFLPRIVLGTYFRDQFFRLLELGQQRGFAIEARVRHEILDIVPMPHAIRVSGTTDAGEGFVRDFDDVVVATGHMIDEEEAGDKRFHDSPYPTRRLHSCPPCRVGIVGTSLSAIDAAVTIAAQHGTFSGDGRTYVPYASSDSLRLTLMSRNGYLPEADFYCPLPYQPLDIFSEDAVDAQIAAGSEKLLDRLFALFLQQLVSLAPAYPAAGQGTTADNFAARYFEDREQADPIEWARSNLREAETNHLRRQTVGWRYAILRMHEPFERAVGSFDETDGERFNAGLKRVFVDNYAAIPPASVRRILALADAGCLDILRLGEDYELSDPEEGASFKLRHQEGERIFDVVVVATGEPRRSHEDYPFPGLMDHFERVERFGRPCTLDSDFRIPATRGGSVYFLALPYLLEDRPFVQGLVGCHELGTKAASAIIFRASAEAADVEAGPLDMVSQIGMSPAA